MWLRILSNPAGGAEAPDSASCLTRCLLSLDCLPLFLRPLSSLIRLTLWLKFFRKGRWRNLRKDHRVLLRFA